MSLWYSVTISQQKAEAQLDEAGLGEWVRERRSGENSGGPSYLGMISCPLGVAFARRWRGEAPPRRPRLDLGQLCIFPNFPASHCTCPGGPLWGWVQWSHIHAVGFYFTGLSCKRSHNLVCKLLQIAWNWFLVILAWESLCSQLGLPFWFYFILVIFLHIVWKETGWQVELICKYIAKKSIF